MEPSQVSQLMSAVRAELDASRHEHALRLLLDNFDRLPDPTPLRECVAAILADTGRRKDAVEILQLVGRHWANAGQPARALAAALKMRRIHPDTTVLLEHIVTLYNIRSPFLSAEERPAPLPEPNEALTLDADSGGGPEDLEALMDEALARALRRDGIAEQPGKLPPLSLLSLLPAEPLRAAIRLMRVETCDQAQSVLERGRVDRRLAWAVSDDLVLRDTERKVRLPTGTMLGLSGFGQASRSPEVDVLALPGSELLVLSSEAIDELDREIGDFSNRLATLRRHAVTERLLRRHPIFEGLSEEARLSVIGGFTGMRVRAGEPVVRQNTPSPGLFIILDGEVDIVRHDEEWEITIATLGSGEVFGEIGLVSALPTVAGCTVTVAGHLLHLPREDFDDLIERFPSIARYTSALAQERMSDASTTLTATDLAEVE